MFLGQRIGVFQCTQLGSHEEEDLHMALGISVEDQGKSWQGIDSSLESLGAVDFGRLGGEK